ncbi:hypothetical protein NVP1261O_66 [Vibrio phage 1.261.O._10N.286.51.A7]|uniref:DNA-directed RNA polymerase C-terminal domain-containing protein n=1 Tax=Vibrio phage 1.261.O._10N.286.51.A7 TaxID=1881237 RepID=A0A2I7RZJ7_9CAUD|nr:RNA polymerase [Vibrio phage 1.261.O._10N.286.51.A7]AUR99070.1 hypothetical protein NVP1261O_66 [Vibrio phage 1.261.O._10N.286.51.A7]
MKDWREFTGRDWLLVDIANMFGWDKELYHVRIENAEGIVDLGREKALEMAEEADKKERYRFIRAVTEYFNLLEQSKTRVPTTGYRVGQDAGASGLQMFSAITGCKSGAALCGLTGQVRANAYATLYGYMSDSNFKFDDALPADVKYAIMT